MSRTSLLAANVVTRDSIMFPPALVRARVLGHCLADGSVTDVDSGDLL